MSRLTVRHADEADRPRIAALAGEAFVSPPARPFPVEAVDIENAWVACKDGTVVATARALPVGQWFGGRSVPSAAVTTVAVAAEARGQGAGRTLLTALLEQTRTMGQPLSVLYPSVSGPYRRLGYEHAGENVRISAALESFPGCGGPAAEALDLSDLSEVRGCYDASRAQAPGSIDRTDSWWRHVVMRVRSGGVLYAHGIREDGVLTGYVLATKEQVPGLFAYRFDVNVLDAAWTTPAAGRGLLALLRSHAGLGQSLHWPGHVADPWSRLPSGAAPQVSSSYPWMLRLVDVGEALVARGYPPDVSTSVALRVVDPTLPANAGCHRVEVAEGRASVSPADDAAVTLDVGALAMLYTGYTTAGRLVTSGELTGASTADVLALEAMFRGPSPLMSDFF